MRVLGDDNKYMYVLVAVVCLLSLAEAQEPWGGESPRPRAQVYALEALGALGGTCVCLGAGILAASKATSWLQSTGGKYGVADVVLPVSVAVLPGCAAFAAIKVGEKLGEDGSSALAFVGAYVGLPLAAGAIALGAYIASEGRQYSGRPSYWGIPFYVLGGLAVPTSAVVGYNLGAPSRSDFGSRLQPPGVALTSVELPDHSVEYGVKVQLAGLRF